MDEWFKREITVLGMNIIMLMVLAALAVEFEKWWIILFSALFWSTIKE